MANEYGHKQWKIDTSGVITTDRIRINKMELLPNAAGDDLVVEDNNGEDVWTVTNALTGGRAGLESFLPSKPIDADGFNVSTLGASCVLSIWFD